MKCVQCDYEWSATPKSKIANFKKHGMKGCPICTNNMKYKEERIMALELLKTRGFEVLSEAYTGKRRIEPNKFIKIKVKNIKCGHIFESLPANLLGRDVTCPICNTQRKLEALQKFNIERQKEYQKTATPWGIYRHRVYQLTRQTYKEYHKIINPNNFSRGRAGTDGAYQLDHIVPIRYCFEHNIPAETCAHYSNLQMLHWDVNLASRNYLKENTPVPSILQEYIP